MHMGLWKSAIQYPTIFQLFRNCDSAQEISIVIIRQIQPRSIATVRKNVAALEITDRERKKDCDVCHPNSSIIKDKERSFLTFFPCSKHFFSSSEKISHTAKRLDRYLLSTRKREGGRRESGERHLSLSLSLLSPPPSLRNFDSLSPSRTLALPNKIRAHTTSREMACLFAAFSRFSLLKSLFLSLCNVK